MREADISFDEPGEPKTGERTVPIPESLVAMLRDWIDTKQIGEHELLFRTRTDRRPTHSNWARTWQRALRQSGHKSAARLRHPPRRSHHVARRRRAPR